MKERLLYWLSSPGSSRNSTVYQKSCSRSGGCRIGRRDDSGLVANAVRSLDL